MTIGKKNCFLKSAIVTSQVNQKLPIPSKKEIAEEITFNGYKTSIKQHISLLVFALLKNDNRLNCLFKNLEFDNELALNDSKFNLIRNIDLLFILLYKLNNSELVLVLHSFSKQYSKSDLMWFKKELEQLFLFNNAVSTSSSFIAASCPIG